MLPMLLISLSLIGCATAPISSFRIVTPKVQQYSPEFLNRAVDEFTSIPLKGCERDEGHQNCSALKTIVKDGLTARDQSRAAQVPVEELK